MMQKLTKRSRLFDFGLNSCIKEINHLIEDLGWRCLKFKELFTPYVFDLNFYENIEKLLKARRVDNASFQEEIIMDLMILTRRAHFRFMVNVIELQFNLHSDDANAWFCLKECLCHVICIIILIDYAYLMTERHRILRKGSTTENTDAIDVAILGTLVDHNEIGPIVGVPLRSCRYVKIM
ncbi:hypothetical protein Tco_1199416 [Tanacetum coccineum]